MNDRFRRAFVIGVAIVASAAAIAIIVIATTIIDFFSWISAI